MKLQEMMDCNPGNGRDDGMLYSPSMFCMKQESCPMTVKLYTLF